MLASYSSIIPHALTGFLCITALIIVVNNVLLVRRVYPCVLISRIIYYLLAFQSLTIIVFMVNQTGWALTEHDDVIGTKAALAWLAYDYLSTIFHITVGVALNCHLRTVRGAKRRPTVCFYHKEEK